MVHVAGENKDMQQNFLQIANNLVDLIIVEFYKTARQREERDEKNGSLHYMEWRGHLGIEWRKNIAFLAPMMASFREYLWSHPTFSNDGYIRSYPPISVSNLKLSSNVNATHKCLLNGVGFVDDRGTPTSNMLQGGDHTGQKQHHLVL
jgi:hypothetical protein